MEQFIKGAESVGHEVVRIDAAFSKVHPCIGCEHCECGKNPCVFQDDMIEIYRKVKAADAIVYSTPLYYHAASAQLLSVINRFHGIDHEIKDTEKKCVLLVTGANTDPTFMDGIKLWFATDIRYLGWENAGEVYAHGCTDAEHLKDRRFAEEAFQLGQNI